MKRTLWCGALFLVVWAMLLPVIGSVNNTIGQPSSGVPSLGADTLTADGGNPLPPAPPLLLVADGGNPLPPAPPRGSVQFLAA